MKKLLFIFLLVFFTSTSFSAVLQVNNIGSLNTGGKVYSEWWYTGINPIITGKAAPSSVVAVKVDAASYTTTADSAGNWSYTATLPSGDYKISFTQGAETLAFTLHLGQNLPATTGQTTQSTTPVTGFNQIVAISLGIGVLLLATYFYIIGDPKKHSIFEARVLKED